MRLSDIVGQRAADIIHSPVSTYTSGATSIVSGVGTLLNPHNIIFIIGTFGGLFFAWLTYRSRKRRDDEMSRLDRQRTEQHRIMSDAIVTLLANQRGSLQNVDNAPEVIREIAETIRRETITPDIDRRHE